MKTLLVFSLVKCLFAGTCSVGTTWSGTAGTFAAQGTIGYSVNYVGFPLNFVPGSDAVIQEVGTPTGTNFVLTPSMIYGNLGCSLPPNITVEDFAVSATGASFTLRCYNCLPCTQPTTTVSVTGRPTSTATTTATTAATGSRSTSPSCPPGTNTCPCTPAGTCDASLNCEAGVCKLAAIDNAGASRLEWAGLFLLTLLGNKRELLLLMAAASVLVQVSAQNPCMTVTLQVQLPDISCTVGTPDRICVDSSIIGASGATTQRCVDGQWGRCGANACASGLILNTTTRLCMECSPGDIGVCAIPAGSGGRRLCSATGQWPRDSTGVQLCSCSASLGANCVCSGSFQLDASIPACVGCFLGQNRTCSVQGGEGSQACTCSVATCTWGNCRPTCCNFPFKFQPLSGGCLNPDCAGGNLNLTTTQYSSPCAGGLPSGALTAEQICSLAPGAVPGTCQQLPLGGTQLSFCRALTCVSGVPSPTGTCTSTVIDNCTFTLCGGFGGCPSGQCTIAPDKSAVCSPCGPDANGVPCLGNGLQCVPNPCASNPCDSAASCQPVDVNGDGSLYLPNCTCIPPFEGSGFFCTIFPKCGVANPLQYNSTCDASGSACFPTPGIAVGYDHAACNNCSSCVCMNATTAFRCVDVSALAPSYGYGGSGCPNNCFNSLGRGYCLTEGVCVCSGLWEGPDCGTLGCVKTLNGPCNVNATPPQGSCSYSSNPPVCVCNPGYTNPSGGCNSLTCPACVNGVCNQDTGRCICDSPWVGPSCNLRCCEVTNDFYCNNSGASNTQCLYDPFGDRATCSCPLGWEGVCCNIKQTSCVGGSPPGRCSQHENTSEIPGRYPYLDAGYSPNGFCNDTVQPNFCTCLPGYIGAACNVDNGASGCTPGTWTGLTVTSWTPKSICYGALAPFDIQATCTSCTQSLNQTAVLWMKSVSGSLDPDFYFQLPGLFNGATVWEPNRLSWGALGTGTLNGDYEVHLRTADCQDLLLPGLFSVGDPVFPFFATPNTLLNTLSLQTTLWVSGLVDVPDSISISCGTNPRLTYYSPTSAGCATCVNCPCKPSCSSCVGTSGQIYVTGTEYNYPKITIPAGLTPSSCVVTVKPAGVNCDSAPGSVLTITNTPGVLITRIDPPFVQSGINTGILIQGQGFAPGATIVLSPQVAGSGESTLLRASSFISNTEMQTVIPASVPPGTYTLYISNLDGTAGFNAALTVKVTCSNVEPPVIDAIVPGYLDTSGAQSNVINRLYGTGFDCCGVSGCTVGTCCTGAGINAVCTCTLKAEVSVECKNWLDPNQRLVRIIPPADVTPISDRIYDVKLCGACIGQDYVCVVRVKNRDGSYFDYSSVVTRLPSAKLNKWRSFSDPTAPGYTLNPVALNIARRGAIGTAAKATTSNAFVYAIGGDDGTLSGAKDTMEALSLNKFGDGQSVIVLPFRLPEKLTFGAVSRIGRFLYYSGGWSSALKCASDKVYRGEVLDPTKTPDPFLEVRFKDQISGGGTSTWTEGVYFYRVSALFAIDDQNNPGGESLPGYTLSLVLTAETLPGGATSPIIRLTWDRIPDAVGYRVYRSVNALDPAASNLALPFLWAIGDVGNVTFFEDLSGAPPRRYPLSLSAWPRGFDGPECDVPNPQDPRCCPCVGTQNPCLANIPCRPSEWSSGYLPPLPLGSTGRWHEIPGHFRMHSPRWGHTSFSSPSHLGSPDGYKTNSWFLTVVSGRDCRNGSYPGDTTCPWPDTRGCGKILSTYEALRVTIQPDPPTSKIREFQHTGVVSSKACQATSCNHRWVGPQGLPGSSCCECIQGEGQRHCGWHDLSGVYDEKGVVRYTVGAVAYYRAGSAVKYTINGTASQPCPVVPCSTAATDIVCSGMPGCCWGGNGGNANCRTWSTTACNSPTVGNGGPCLIQNRVANLAAGYSGTNADGCPPFDQSKCPNCFPKCNPLDGRQGVCCPWSEPFSTLLEFNLGRAIPEGVIDQECIGGGCRSVYYQYPGYNEGQFVQNNGRFLAGGTRVGFNDLEGVGFLDSVHVVGPGYANYLAGGKGVSNNWYAAYIDERNTYYPGQYKVNLDPLFDRCEEYSGNRGYNKESCEIVPGCVWGNGNTCEPRTTAYTWIQSYWQNAIESSAQNYGYCNLEAFGIIHNIGGIDGAAPFPGKLDTTPDAPLPQVILAEGRLLPNPGLCCTEGGCNLDDLNRVLSCSNFAGEPRDSAWSLAFAACGRENALFFMMGGMLDTQSRPTKEIFRTTN